MEDEITRAARARRGNPFISSTQAAFYLGYSARHLERLRQIGEGPPYRKYRGRVRYHVDEVLAWSARGGVQ
ncbi:MAG: DNA-binding protein [Zymomonas sp.]|nr:MAG: DNA-binding protein [Zymomonas sp.]